MSLDRSSPDLHSSWLMEMAAVVMGMSRQFGHPSHMVAYMVGGPDCWLSGNVIYVFHHVTIRRTTDLFLITSVMQSAHR